jgi:hypothetical protein
MKRVKDATYFQDIVTIKGIKRSIFASDNSTTILNKKQK